jgi:hypothetical protein
VRELFVTATSCGSTLSYNDVESFQQVTLGISTLLMYVPVSLGAAHQAGALTLFSIVLSLVHALRRPLPGSMAATQKLWAIKVPL